MNKFWAALILLVITSTLLPACITIATDMPDCTKPEIFCVGVVTDVGKIDDKSINEAAWKGVQQAKNELGATIEYIETTDYKDYEKNIATFGESDYDVIISVGFNLGQATAKAAETYPNIKFIGVDQYQDPNAPSPANLTSLAFHEDQAGFLVGALAAQMTQTKKLGAVCGTDAYPPIWRYGEGFKAGAKYIDPAVEVTVAYHNDVSFSKTFSDPEWGAVTASAMIGNGVDIVFGAGEQTGDGAVIAAAQKGVVAIGVSNDQYYSLPEAQKMLLSSATKLITPGLFELIKMAKTDNFPGGNYYGNVGYAPFHDLDETVPDVVKTKMDQIAKDLADGLIKTNVTLVKP
jgi:basic membrane protein A